MYENILPLSNFIFSPGGCFEKKWQINLQFIGKNSINNIL